MPVDIKTIHFDEDVCDLYFAMLLKQPSLLKVALDNVGEAAFRELLPANINYSLFWFCLKTALKNYPDLKLTKPTMFKGCFKLLSSLYDDEEARKQIALELAIMFEKLETLDVVPNREWILDHTKFIMQQGQVAVQAREIMSQVQSKAINMDEGVDKLAALASAMSPTDRAAVDPIEAMMGTTLVRQPLERTYIDWFDAAIGGGFVKNEPHTIIMPTGAGKTTISAMIAAYRAMHGKKTMVVVTESGVHPETLAKPLAAIFDKDANLFLDDSTNPLKQKDLSEDVQLRLRMVKDCIRYVDLVAKSNQGATFETFEAAYAREKQNGFEPSLVIIDWAGLLANSIMASNPKIKDMHTALEHVAIACTRFCSLTGVPIFITHQVAADKAQRNGIKPVYTSQDADNCKKWANHFCTAVVTTKFDDEKDNANKDGYGTFLFDKVRYGSPGKKVIVRRLGARCRFVEAGADIQWEKNRYTNVAKRGAFGKKQNASAAEDET